MKKKTKIIQITGFRGVLMMLFIGSCLAAGFVAFPSLVAMKCWNYVANYISIPLLNIWQGLMLWAIVAISVFIINDRKKYLVAFNSSSSSKTLSEDEIKKILDNVKAQAGKQALNTMMPNEKSDLISNEEKEKENV